MAPASVGRTCNNHMASANNNVNPAAQLPANMGDTPTASMG
jgi:hypothetical protein